MKIKGFIARKTKRGNFQYLEILNLLQFQGPHWMSKTNGTKKCSLLSLSECWQDVYFVQIGAVSNPVLLDTTYRYLLPYLLDVLIFC